MYNPPGSTYCQWVSLFSSVKFGLIICTLLWIDLKYEKGLPQFLGKGRFPIMPSLTWQMKSRVVGEVSCLNLSLMEALGSPLCRQPLHECLWADWLSTPERVFWKLRRGFYKAGLNIKHVRYQWNRLFWFGDFAHFSSAPWEDWSDQSVVRLFPHSGPPTES